LERHPGQEAKPKSPRNHYTQVPGHGAVIALTFDDGPGPQTATLLDALNERQLKATFFVVGQEVEKQADLVKRMVAEGHEVGSHSWNHHAGMNRMSPAPVDRDLGRSPQTILDIIGVEPVLFRPPGMPLSDAETQRLYGEWNYTTVQWSVDMKNWNREQDPKEMKASVLKETQDGSIILAHDRYRPQINAVIDVVDALKAKGFQFLTVSKRRKAFSFSL
ncbi:MAG: polysaccharide deacetylase family protein, partial [Verrucomicrobiales bacterium]